MFSLLGTFVLSSEPDCVSTTLANAQRKEPVVARWRIALITCKPLLCHWRHFFCLIYLLIIRGGGRLLYKTKPNPSLLPNLQNMTHPWMSLYFMLWKTCYFFVQLETNFWGSERLKKVQNQVHDPEWTYSCSSLFVHVCLRPACGWTL